MSGSDADSRPGRLSLVGLGPGHGEHMTGRARDAVAASETVVGYASYLRLIRPLLAGKAVVRTGMTEEVGRAVAAVELAEAGRRVAVISGGDAGIYGMAGLVMEVLAARGWTPADPAPPWARSWTRSEGEVLEVEVVPGVSALNACAALVGAPLMNDFAAVSLSDHLTPWPVIARRLEAAGAGDFVVVLYNPASGRRTWQLAEACRILRRYRDGATPVALVKSAYRERQEVRTTDLDHLPEAEIGMLTTVIVGNSTTKALGDLLVTPRGYAAKYELGPGAGALREGCSDGTV